MLLSDWNPSCCSLVIKFPADVSHCHEGAIIAHKETSSYSDDCKFI